MFDYLLNDQQKKLKQEARNFVKSVPGKMILDMDADKIQFPKEFLREGGEGADYFLVYARTDPDREPHKSISCFIVDRSEGVKTEYLYGLMGCRGGGASRLVFNDVKVPRENLLGELNQGAKIFNTMMIPERLGTAAMTIGAAIPAVDVATGYTTKRKAFGRPVAAFQGVSFQVAEAVTLLDASRSMIYTTARAVDEQIDEKRIRRLVSQSKKFVTESCQKAVHNAMQVMGGIGYTNIYPVERILRDLRLASIWTGTNEVMSVIIANEWYKEYWKMKKAGKIRDMELDAAESDAKDEKIFE
ncbi:acyl-CoA dehydrogenase, C-terminal domain protein [delta proteobacterium NaphS2]|nr:acyl-CoA dehydrogenase, C-terminal domain protein [delta proteobacterium NaphS2]